MLIIKQHDSIPLYFVYYVVHNKRKKYIQSKMALGECLGRKRKKGRLTQRKAIRRCVNPVICGSPLGKPKKKNLVN